MKNSKKLLAAGVVVGCLTVGTTGIIALANGNAYQNFKTAAMQTMQAKNMTVQSVSSVTRNGEVIVSGTQTRQTDGDQFYVSSEMAADGKTVITESAKKDSELIYVIDGKYYQTSFGDEEYGRRDGRSLEDSPNSKKMMEMVTDLLVGDVKNHFSGDQNHVSVSLDGAQVPELLNVAAAAMSEQAGNRRSDRVQDFPDSYRGHMDISQMSNLQIKAISMDADIVNGLLDNTNVSITISYNNAQGQAEEMSFYAESKISDVGTTVPDTIDLTGKTVEEMAE